jgi:CyaY protein
MEDSDFNTRADQVLARIETGLEASGAEVDFQLAAGGILEIEFENGSKIIVNKHGVAKEIWVAARSGGFHFRWDGAAWHDTRDGEDLLEKLSRLVSQQAGEPVVLS